MAGTNAGGELCSARLGLARQELEDEEEGDEKTKTAPGLDKRELGRRSRRDGRRVEVSPAATAPVWAAYRHNGAQEETMNKFE